MAPNSGEQNAAKGDLVAILSRKDLTDIEFADAVLGAGSDCNVYVQDLRKIFSDAIKVVQSEDKSMELTIEDEQAVKELVTEVERRVKQAGYIVESDEHNWSVWASTQISTFDGLFAAVVDYCNEHGLSYSSEQISNNLRGYVHIFDPENPNETMIRVDFNGETLS